MPAYAKTRPCFLTAAPCGARLASDGRCRVERGRRRAFTLSIIHIFRSANSMKRVLCQLLIVLMAWTPFQIAQAGMIGTDQVVSSSSQADRSTVLGFVGRTDVAGQLQA